MNKHQRPSAELRQGINIINFIQTQIINIHVLVSSTNISIKKFMFSKTKSIRNRLPIKNTKNKNKISSFFTFSFQRFVIIL